MEEEKKEEVKQEETSEPEKQEKKQEVVESSESSESSEKEVERTPVEEAVAEQVNNGDAKELAKFNEKLDIIIGLLSDKSPNFNANDSEEKTEQNSDETSKAELEAIENILD